MPRKQRDVESGLRAKGFLDREGDHTYFVYWSNTGKKSAVFTKTSHGAKEINDNLLGQMARQCKLNKSEFGNLIDCPLTREEYEAKLISAGFVDPAE